jgi:hypothetical protein
MRVCLDVDRINGDCCWIIWGFIDDDNAMFVFWLVLIVFRLFKPVFWFKWEIEGVPQNWTDLIFTVDWLLLLTWAKTFDLDNKGWLIWWLRLDWLLLFTWDDLTWVIFDLKTC